MVLHGRTRCCPSTKGQRGETLIELLFTVTLMAIGFSVLFGAMITAVATSSTNATRTRANTYLATWAERVQAPAISAGATATTPGPINYGECGSPLTISPPPLPDAGAPASTPASERWGASYTIEYLNGPADSVSWNNLRPATFWTTAPSCPTSGDIGIQRITLEVWSPDTGNQVRERIVIIKRNPRCPATFNNADLGPC